MARSKDPAFAVDGTGRVIIWNQAAEALLGYPAEEILGEPCYGLFCGAGTDRSWCEARCCLRSREPEPVQQLEMTVPTAHGGRERISMCALSFPQKERSASTILHFFRALPTWDGAADASGQVNRHPALTAREREILALLADGKHTKEIARRLCISLATVRNHIHHILRKLDAHTRMEAIARARRFSLI